MNNFTVPSCRPIWRWLGLAWGVICLGWLGLEERNALFVTLLGATAAWLVITPPILSRFGGKLTAVTEIWGVVLLYGAAIGFGAAINAALLMLFKAALHAHPVPEYSLAQILGTIERGPIWALAGALFALGALLSVLGKRRLRTSA